MELINDLQSRYDALIAEKKKIEDYLSKVPELEKRLRQLVGGWGYPGKIKEAQCAINDNKYPVHELNVFFERHKRIIDVDKKWIYMKIDGVNGPHFEYNIKTGRPKASRSDANSINVKRALEIWDIHIKSLQK